MKDSECNDDFKGSVPAKGMSTLLLSKSLMNILIDKEKSLRRGSAIEKIK